MSFIDKYYTIFNNSVGQHSVNISRTEFANLLGVFSKNVEQLDQLKAERDLLKQECDNWEQQVLFADEQIDKLQDEIHLLQQYKKSKQASYESMQEQWQKAVSQNQDLLKQNEQWQKQVAELKAENYNIKSLIWWVHVGAEGAEKVTTEYYENRNTQYEENYWKRIRALQPSTYESKYKLVLAEIKEIIEKWEYTASVFELEDKILQKISEVIPNGN